MYQTLLMLPQEETAWPASITKGVHLAERNSAEHSPQVLRVVFPARCLTLTTVLNKHKSHKLAWLSCKDRLK